MLACGKNPSNPNANKTVPLGNWKETYSNLIVYGINDSLLLNNSIYVDTNKAVEGFMQINDSNIFKYIVIDSCYYLTTMPYTLENYLHSLTWFWNAPNSFIRGVTEIGNGLFNTSDSIFLYDTVSYDNTSTFYGLGYRKSYNIVKFVKINVELPNSNWPNKLCN
jgi:hypothetical protein